MWAVVAAKDTVRLFCVAMLKVYFSNTCDNWLRQLVKLAFSNDTSMTLNQVQMWSSYRLCCLFCSIFYDILSYVNLDLKLTGAVNEKCFQISEEIPLSWLSIIKIRQSTKLHTRVLVHVCTQTHIYEMELGESVSLLTVHAIFINYATVCNQNSRLFVSGSHGCNQEEILSSKKVYNFYNV